MCKERKDIANANDIRVFVNEFYKRIREDELLGNIFNQKIGEGWPVHLEKMVGFWQSLLLSDRTYHGRPFPPHIGMPIERNHFERWVKLFQEVINEHFVGPVAEEAILRATSIARIFQFKLESMKNK